MSFQIEKEARIKKRMHREAHPLLMISKT